MKDVVIVGSGPAGASAALYIARANLSLTVIGGESALARAEKIENYYGLPAPVSGRTLYENGLAQLRALGVTPLDGEVVDIAFTDGFETALRSGVRLTSRAVILCTGAKRVQPAMRRLSDFEGHGVSYCAVCDAFFYRGKDVAVLGGGAYALHEAQTLLPVARSVTLLTNGTQPTADFPREIKLVRTPIESLLGDALLAGVRLTDGTELPFAGLFIALGTAGASDLARKLGAEVRGADIVTDEHMATLLPGLYAAGDCTGGILQVATAVAEGARAALSAIRFLRGD